MNTNTFNSFEFTQQIGRDHDSENYFTPRPRLDPHSFSFESISTSGNTIETKRKSLLKNVRSMYNKEISDKKNISPSFLLKKIMSLGSGMINALKTPFTAIHSGVKAYITKVQLYWNMLPSEEKRFLCGAAFLILAIVGSAAIIFPPAAPALLGSVALINLGFLFAGCIKGFIASKYQELAQLERQQIQRERRQTQPIHQPLPVAPISPIRLSSTASDISINSRAKTELMD